MRKACCSSLIITLSLFMSACQPTAPSQAPQSDGIADIRVNTATPTETRVTSETFPLPNCGGTGEIHQTLGTTASITKSVTVSGKATVRGGGEADVPETVKLKLEIEIEVAYQKTYESANSRLDTINMPAAAGTHVVYEIGWYEQVFSSLVEYSSNGQVYEVPYTYKLRVPKIDNSYQVACDSNGATNIIPSNTQPVPQPTIAQIPTSTEEVMWQDLGIFYGKGNTKIGDSDKWMVFQVWNGIDTSTTVHGVIEPGWFLIIPTPIQGTTWMVSGYSNDYIFSRVLQMRDEVVQRDKIAVPPLIYIGANPAPSGFTTQLPSGWTTAR